MSSFEKIKKHYSNELTIKEVAKRANVSEGSVKLFIRANNIKRRKEKVKIKEKKVQALIKEGYTRKEIEKKLNLSYGTVFNCLKKRKRNPGIYCLTSLIDGRKYVGKSVNLNLRKQQFENSSKYNTKTPYAGKYINEALKKYGPHNFERTILTHCKEEELDDKEKFYIKRLKTEDPKYGFNIQETKEKKTKEFVIVRLKFRKKDVSKIDNLENYIYSAVYEKLKEDNIT